MSVFCLDCCQIAAILTSPNWAALITQEQSERELAEATQLRLHSHPPPPPSLFDSFAPSFTLKSVELIISTLSPAIRAAEKRDNKKEKKLLFLLSGMAFSFFIYFSWWETLLLLARFTRQSGSKSYWDINWQLLSSTVKVMFLSSLPLVLCLTDCEHVLLHLLTFYNLNTFLVLLSTKGVYLFLCPCTG